jgi:predicted nucleic acid-binding protein
VTVVLDASVILKWLLEDPITEPDTEKALALIDAVILGKLEILQPVHWLIEVAAVAARLTPQTAVKDVELLSAMQLPTSDDPGVLLRATRLAIET